MNEMTPLEIIASVVTIIGVVLAVVTIFQASWLSYKANQPALAVRVTYNPSLPDILEVSIRNYGSTMAEDVRLSSDEPPMRPPHVGESEAQVLEIFDRAWTLAPGEEWRTTWDHYRECKELNPSKMLHGVATCVEQGRPWFACGGQGRLEFPYVLDLAQYENRYRMDEYTVHRVGKLLASVLETEHDSSENAIRVKHFQPPPQTMAAIDRHMARLQRGQGGA